MTHFNIDLNNRFPDSRSGELYRSDEYTPATGVKARTGRAAWPFLVGARRVPEGREGRDAREALTAEPSFSS